MTVRLRDERMNRIKAEVVIIDQGKETDDFWAAIGGKGDIAPAEAYPSCVLDCGAHPNSNLTLTLTLLCCHRNVKSILTVR